MTGCIFGEPSTMRQGKDLSNPSGTPRGLVSRVPPPPPPPPPPRFHSHRTTKIRFQISYHSLTVLFCQGIFLELK